MRPDQAFRRRGHLARAWARLLRKKIAVACIIILVVIYAAGVLANWTSPYGYNQQDYTEIRESPSLHHLAGTDRAGRGVFGDTQDGPERFSALRPPLP